MINTICPAKDCIERLENYPPFCRLHWKIMPWAMASDLNLNYRSEKVKQNKHFRALMERATRYIDELVGELLVLRDHQPKKG